MTRYCRGCNRPLTEEGHDVSRKARWWIDGSDSSGRPRFVYGDNRRVYACRVKLVAVSPVSGKQLNPKSPQRIKELDTKYVHE